MMSHLNTKTVLVELYSINKKLKNKNKKPIPFYKGNRISGTHFLKEFRGKRRIVGGLKKLWRKTKTGKISTRTRMCAGAAHGGKSHIEKANHKKTAQK